METIKLILTSVMFAFYFIEVARFHQFLRLDFKPFNCMTCLPVWTSLVLYCLPNVVTHILFFCIMAGIVGPMFRNLFINIFNKTK